MLELRVARREAAATGVVLLELADPAGAELPEWEPGAHIDLLLPGFERQYSLCGEVRDRRKWTIAVLLEPDGRGGSAYVHASLHEGATVQVREPRNHFQFDPATEVVFIAGGIGITPLLPMVRAADEAGVPWQLWYGGRSRDTMAFAGSLLECYGTQRIHVLPQDETGLLDLPGILGEPRPGVSVYCCGPEPLLKAVEAQWPAETLHLERFTPREVATPVQGFEVQLGEGGQVLTIPPDRSILSVLEEAGVDVVSSCQEGTCGTCETFVLDGVPEHRDSVLSAAERDQNDVLMICVSRAVSPRLVLDL